MRSITLAFIYVLLGYALGTANDPYSYTTGFIHAFKSAPKECREGLLINYAKFIFSEESVKGSFND